MYLTDKIIYVDLPKTATRTVYAMLGSCLDGRLEGKHRKPSPLLLAGNRRFIATVRNPWDWYLSLWTYGCKVHHQSGPYDSLTRWRPFRLRGRGFGQAPAAATRGVLKRLVLGCRADWIENRTLYADPDDPSLFRRWLSLVFDRRRLYQLSPYFDQSDLSAYAGSLTFRFCALYCHYQDKAALHRGRLGSIEALTEWEEKHSYIDRWIRVCHLQEDFFEALAHCDCELTAAQRESLSDAPRKNVSRRSGMQTAEYYDSETIALVESNEQLLIRKFGFPSPSQTHESST